MASLAGASVEATPGGAEDAGDNDADIVLNLDLDFRSTTHVMEGLPYLREKERNEAFHSTPLPLCGACSPLSKRFH
jgi:hypothetical protein